jgi:hypothetical protein
MKYWNHSNSQYHIEAKNLEEQEEFTKILRQFLNEGCVANGSALDLCTGNGRFAK